MVESWVDVAEKVREESKRGDSSVEVMKRWWVGFKGLTFLGRFWSQRETAEGEASAAIRARYNFRPGRRASDQKINGIHSERNNDTSHHSGESRLFRAIYLAGPPC
jgi:hypothetical protein